MVPFFLCFCGAAGGVCVFLYGIILLKFGYVCVLPSGWEHFAWCIFVVFRAKFRVVGSFILVGSDGCLDH